MSENTEQVIIIGSGPAGLTAGIYTARSEMKPLLFTGSEIGGQVNLTMEVENYPGFPDGITGPELVQRMQKQAERFGCRVIVDTVTEVKLDEHPFVVKTQSGKEHRCKALIITTGASPRRLGVPGEKELTGRGVSYCATCDGFFFRGKEVAVVGGGDAAIEEALFLALSQETHPDRPHMIIFITDGKPTIGETDEDKLIKKIEKANGLSKRIFISISSEGAM